MINKAIQIIRMQVVRVTSKAMEKSMTNNILNKSMKNYVLRKLMIVKRMIEEV